jgi:anti-sigma regulatory factor (Ser/Thr protein kinase)
MARRVLDLYGVGVVDDVEIVVSELITNAVRVSRPDWPVTLRLLIDQEAVLVAVHDESDELPEIRDVGLDETAGRGLLIVEALSGGHCGYTLGLYGGKTVWALISRT